MRQMLVLVDYENIPQIDLSQLPPSAEIMIFVGAAQKNLPTELTMAAHLLGKRLAWCRIEQSAPQALDFFIACYLGQVLMLSVWPDCFVLSKDTGYDPLLVHLCTKGLPCRRIESLSELSQEPGLSAAVTPPKAPATSPASGSQSTTKPASPPKAPATSPAPGAQSTTKAASIPKAPAASPAPGSQSTTKPASPPKAPATSPVKAPNTAAKPSAKAAPKLKEDEQRVFDFLKALNTSSRPRKRQTLINYIHAQKQAAISKERAATIIDSLITQKVLAEKDGKLVYSF